MTKGHKLLRDHIFESLRRSIVTGALKPDERIVELDLARQFETSQGPVREALQRLATEGLVETRRYRGTYVAPLNHHELQSISEIRKTVEGVAAREAARVMTQDQLEVASGLIDQMIVSAEQDDFDALVQHDLAFHRHVCECSLQPTLTRVWGILASQVERFVTIYHPQYFTNLREIAVTHQPLLDALTAKTPDIATKRFREHIDMIWNKIESVNIHENH